MTDQRKGSDSRKPTADIKTSQADSESRATVIHTDVSSNLGSRTPESSGPRLSESKRVDAGGSSIRPRPSRWADEVDEDDNFMGTDQRFARRASPVQKEKVVPLPVTAPPRVSSSMKPMEKRPLVSPRDSAGPVPSRPARLPVREVHRVVAPTVKPSLPKTSTPSQAEIDEILHMKETMAKKAEERKKQKEADEAKLEAERKERCEAKLREIEARQRSRTTSVVIEEPKEPKVQTPTKSPKRAPKPLVATPSQSSHIGDDQKEEAFNTNRRALRERRDKDRKVDEPLESSTNLAVAQLSPDAKEFIPVTTIPAAPLHHWPQFAQQMAPPHARPQVSHIQQSPGGHSDHPMGHPHMMGMVMGPGGQHQMPPQMPQGQMGYGYGQYPQFPYGYPQSHQMGNHFY